MGVRFWGFLLDLSRVFSFLRLSSPTFDIVHCRDRDFKRGRNGVLRIYDMKRSMKLKRVSWAPGVNLCQVYENFRSYKDPSRSILSDIDT